MENGALGPGLLAPDYRSAHLELKPFYSRNKSFLKLHSLDKVLPCEGQQEVQVEYIIRHTELKNDANHFDLHYLVRILLPTIKYIPVVLINELHL